MANPLISAVLMLLVIVAVTGSIALFVRLAKPTTADAQQQSNWPKWLTLIVGVGCAVLFVVRGFADHRGLPPLATHLDGLLMVNTIVAMTLAYLQWRGRLRGLAVFAMPILALLLLWALCSAAWTYRPFRLDSLHPVWQGLHLVAVYLGSACAVMAGGAGAFFLYRSRQIRHKRIVPGGGAQRVSLEAIERLLITSTTIGFALLTVAMVTGVVIVAIREGDTVLVASWWLGPKVVLATLAWLVFALVMNVRYASRFRGARAAWLSLAGLGLLLLTMVVVTVMSASRDQSGQSDATPATSHVSQEGN